MIRICVRPEDLAGRASEARPDCSCPAPEVARVLVKQHGIDCFRHHVSDHEIGVGRPQVPSVTLYSLAERRSRVRQLSFAREQYGKCGGTAVKRFLRSNLELFLRSEWLIGM